MPVDLRRIRFYEWMLSLFGAGLLGVMFLDWYGVGARRVDAWQAFGAIDVVLAIVGGLAVSIAVAAATHRTAAVPLALAGIATIAAGVATLLVLIRAASPPHLTPAGSITREPGLWLGLICSIGMSICGWRSLADEHFPAAMRPQLDVERVALPPTESPTS
jgi:hypothetical protein